MPDPDYGQMSDDELLAAFRAHEATQQLAPAKPGEPEGWGPASSLISGLGLGTLPEQEAAAKTTGTIINSQGEAVKVAEPSGSYESNLEYSQGQRKAYNDLHPLLGPGLEIIGSMPAVALTNALTPGLPLAQGAGMGARMLSGAARIGTSAIRGAEAGAEQNKITGNDLLDDMLWGAGTMGALQTVGEAARLAPGIPRVNASTARAAQGLAAQGVNLRPGQLAMSRAWKKADQLLVNPSHNDQQLEDYTKALAGVFGEEDFQPKTLTSAAARIGAKLDDVAKDSFIANDTTLSRQLDAALPSIGVNASDRRLVKGVYNLIKSSFGPGNVRMDGDTYQTLTRKGGALSDLISNKEPSVREAGIRLRAALDDGLERFTSLAHPERLDDLHTARDQWKALMVLQPLAEGSTSKIIDPKKVKSAVSQGYKDFGWAPISEDGLGGQRTLAQLAEGGQHMPKATPEGSAKHVGGLRHTLLGSSGIAGILAGGIDALHSGIDVGTAASAAAAASLTYGAGKAGGAALASDWWRNMVLDNALGIQRQPGRTMTLAPALVSGTINQLRP